MKRIVGLVITFLFLVSCINIDDDQSTHPINGTWKLKNVSGGLRAVNLDYNDGEVTFVFSSENGKLNVKNTIITTGPKDVYAPLETGDYLYEIKLENDVEVLYINNIKNGVISIKDNTLEINTGVASDGFLYKYSR